MTEGIGPVCGMTWGWVGQRAQWQTPNALYSFEAMDSLNLNWVTLAFQALQDTAQSTQIDYKDESLVTDDQLRWAIRLAKSKGYRVCLKPVVNCRNGTWRGFISFFDHDVPGEPSWSEWFESYQGYMNHYAELAAEEGVDLFCVGCEMVMSDKQEDHWRNTIREVRKRYQGPVTYNCDKYQEDRVTWWDEVDVISSSGYYPINTWDAHMLRIEQVVNRYRKPFLFLEAGCPSRTNSPSRPNDWTLEGPADSLAQHDYYEQMLRTFEFAWMQGFMLWDWPALLYSLESAETNRDYCIFGKPSEALVGRIYKEVQERAS